MRYDKIFSKFRNTKYIYVILIIGTALMLFSQLPEKKTENPTPVRTEESTAEDRLSKILSKIDGAGRVSVMITYSAGGEKSLAYETKSEKKDSADNGAESFEKKAVMSKNEPFVLKEIYPSVKGVVVVAEGANSPAVKQALCDAVAAATGIAVHKICILPGM